MSRPRQDMTGKRVFLVAAKAEERWREARKVINGLRSDELLPAAMLQPPQLGRNRHHPLQKACLLYVQGS